MKELSLNILDIVENSVKAGAKLTVISVTEQSDTLTIEITDNGSGMTDEVLESVTNPFYTTRTTRKVGMGIPLLKLEAELTGGNLKIVSRHISEHPEDHGTTVTAVFNKNHIDFTPLGDVTSTLTTLIQGHPDLDFMFIHKTGEREVKFDTRDLRKELEGIPLNNYEVLKWIEEYIKEQYI